MRVLIAGGTGFIGSALVSRWRQRGADVTVLTRNPAGGAPGGATAVGWDDPAWRDAARDSDAVVNLAGASIGRRWTPAHKREILSSRLRATRSLVEALCAEPRPGQVLVNMSGDRYYGSTTDDTPLTERDGAGDDFMATVAARWEAAAGPVTECGVRLVRLRTGIVLGRGGGTLPRFLLPFRLGLGGPFGSGRQYVSWIHLDDLCRLILFAVEQEDLSGPVNATAPNPVTNETFSRVLGRVLHRPARLRAPAAALRLVLGEMSTLLLEGQRVLPQRATAAGFAFRFPDLEGALRDLLGREERPSSGARR